MKASRVIVSICIFLSAISVHAAADNVPGKTYQEALPGELVAQYIPDEQDPGKKMTIEEMKRKEASAKSRARFVMGASGGLDAREGFASMAVNVPMGMQYGKYALTFSPAYIYMSAKSIRTKSSPLDRILRTRTDGQVYEFALPALFTYSILDLPAHIYTPYVTGGAGYSFRKFSLSGKSLVSMTSRVYSLHSMTLNYGFGFLVRTSDDTRLDIGFTCQSYFNRRNGPFDYDTTGAGLHFGFMILID